MKKTKLPNGHYPRHFYAVLCYLNKGGTVWRPYSGIFPSVARKVARKRNDVAYVRQTVHICYAEYKRMLKRVTESKHTTNRYNKRTRNHV